MNRALRASAAIVAATFLSGCYSWIPVELEAAPAATELRVFMSRRALVDVPEGIPVFGTYVTGRLARQTADSILIQVPVSRTVDAPGALDLRQNVFLPKSEIVDLQYRRLNRGKTVAALVGGGALATAILTVVVSSGGSAEERPGDVPDQIRIPILAFPAP
jgi:hypothetical protein